MISTLQLTSAEFTSLGFVLGFTCGVIITWFWGQSRWFTPLSENAIEKSVQRSSKATDLRILAERTLLRVAWDHPRAKKLPASLLYDELIDRALEEIDIQRNPEGEYRDQAFLTPLQESQFTEYFELAVLNQLYDN